MLVAALLMNLSRSGGFRDAKTLGDVTAIEPKPEQAQCRWLAPCGKFVAGKLDKDFAHAGAPWMDIHESET